MNYVVGLGNPGTEYQKTRHNVGFMVVDEVLRKVPEFQGKWSEKFSSHTFKSSDTLFVKPDTFMNDSGKAVREVMDFYKGETKNLYVIHDDLDIATGSYKIQLGTGPKVHNGLTSIYTHLHTEEFWHVRVGVDGRNGDRTIPSRDYVLTPFSVTEQEILDDTIQRVSRELSDRLHPRAVVKKDFQALGTLFDGFQLEDKGGYITQEFQDFGYRLAMELDDQPHKSLYMRLAKTENRALLEQALSFVSDAATVKSKARLFMWKLKQLKLV